MTERRPGGQGKRGARQVAELSNSVLDPVLARKAGINTALLSAWPEIAGENFADCTRPEKIAWPRRHEPSEEGGGAEGGVLTVACEGARALFLTHAQGELIQRINGFFGFPAVRQIRIVQKPVVNGPVRRRPRVLSPTEKRRLDGMVEGVEEGALKEALMRLGTAMINRKYRR